MIYKMQTYVTDYKEWFHLPLLLNLFTSYRIYKIMLLTLKTI